MYGPVLSIRHAMLANPRVLYGLRHLPGALLSILAATAVVGVAFGLLRRRRAPVNLPRWAAALTIVLVFFAVWGPAWWSGGFTMDDWRLLAAGAIRHSVEAHPWLSWSSLDSVDGNFRPLGTVLYFGYMFRWFGAAARIFMLGPLVMTLLSVLVLYAVVRELGYDRGQGVAAAVLFASRGLLYAVATWSAALGDGISLCFCGLSVLLTLKAARRGGWTAVGLHGLALAAFVTAALGKQSAFCLPLILSGLVYLRPGRLEALERRRRLVHASAMLMVYGVTAVALYLHAKSLAHGSGPYPIGLSKTSTLRLFGYPCWYLVVVELPTRLGLGNLPAEAAGVAVLAGVAVWTFRRRASLNAYSRDLVFAAFSAAASLCLFALLPTRAAPYYGGMFAFWVSAGLGIVLAGGAGMRTRRTGLWVVLLIVWSGFVEVRLEQTGLVPSGSYVWGTYSDDSDRAARAFLDERLQERTDSRTVVLARCNDSFAYPAMVLLDAPAVQRILVRKDVDGVYLVTDLDGLRPADDRSNLTNPGAYSWTVPMDRARAAALVAGSDVQTITCPEETFGKEPEAAGAN